MHNLRLDAAAALGMNAPPRVLLSSSAQLRAATVDTPVAIASSSTSTPTSTSHSAMIMMNTDENAISDFNFEVY